MFISTETAMNSKLTVRRIQCKDWSIRTSRRTYDGRNCGSPRESIQSESFIVTNSCVWLWWIVYWRVKNFTCIKAKVPLTLRRRGTDLWTILRITGDSEVVGSFSRLWNFPGLWYGEI
uniref:Uncharacterized protein n=1 Tax=Cacopsylla melanoneura TaxID=428564 RepID=A0A8D9F8G6_9HEMI